MLGADCNLRAGDPDALFPWVRYGGGYWTRIRSAGEASETGRNISLKIEMISLSKLSDDADPALDIRNGAMRNIVSFAARNRRNYLGCVLSISGVCASGLIGSPPTLVKTKLSNQIQLPACPLA
jgi:hypothetical protein